VKWLWLEKSQELKKQAGKSLNTPTLLEVSGFRNSTEY